MMKKIMTACCVSVLIASNLYAGGIPVIDLTSITTNTEEHIETIAKWAQQYQQMVQQINQLQQQYNALTGIRNLGNIFNNPAFRNYLPSDWKNIYDKVKSGGLQGLTSHAASIYNDNKVFDMCSSLLPDHKARCEAKASKPSMDQAFAMDAYDQATSRLDQIDQLMGQINQTDDPKAIAELQARIASEQAMIHNEQIKLQLYQMAAQAQDKINAQREKEIQAEVWSMGRSNPSYTPISFNK